MQVPFVGWDSSNLAQALAQQERWFAFAARSSTSSLVRRRASEYSPKAKIQRHLLFHV